MGDRLWTGKPSQYVTGQWSPMSTQPSIPLEYVNRVPACLTGVNAGCVHLCWETGNTV